MDDLVGKSASENNGLVNPVVSSASKDVDEVNLCSDKILPLRLAPLDKGKQIVSSSEHV